MSRKHSGTALVEFALIVPLILVLTFTVVECGRAIQRYNSVAKAVRDGVRYASMQQPNTSQLAARNLIVFGNTQGNGPPLDPNLTLANVPDPTWAVVGASPPINTVTIKVTAYKFTPIASTVFGLVLPTITFGDVSATMRCPL